jgi:hypothetical protein
MLRQRADGAIITPNNSTNFLTGSATATANVRSIIGLSCWSRTSSTVVAMRDGVPLPGTTPPAVISQLAQRVFGPRRPDRWTTTGLAGHPADRQAAVAARHGITARTVANWSTALRAAGSRLPLSPDLATELTRRTRPREDHLARTAPRPPSDFHPRPRRSPRRHPPVPRRPIGPPPRSPPGSWPRPARSLWPCCGPRSNGPADSNPGRR